VREGFFDAAKQVVEKSQEIEDFCG
jgi:hypothetical protein